jgi:hypothetical protein
MGLRPSFYGRKFDARQGLPAILVRDQRKRFAAEGAEGIEKDRAQ